ncbi:unnamed protein product [Peniophora sp. CBMAI 1063]|nr:unnamed protein product [Peniophora sp. CBMAI 1063]
MKSTFATAIVLGALSSGASARLFTVYNQCPFTIWPAWFAPPSLNAGKPTIASGWVQNAYQTVSFGVPDNWVSGRIWGRRNCDFSSNPGPNSCLDGGCNGGLVCDVNNGGTGVPPASLAEFTLSVNPSVPDNYDVSLVDGYNLPIRIDNNRGCPVGSCPVDLGPNCPAALKGPYDSSGFPVGCKSACVALGGENNCCSGSHNTAATCPPSGVTDYSYFKNNCPDSYVYAYDESSGTALFTCPLSNGVGADYTITFCP